MKTKTIQQIWDQFDRIHMDWVNNGMKSWWINKADNITRKYVANIISATVGTPRKVGQCINTPCKREIYAK